MHKLGGHHQQDGNILNRVLVLTFLFLKKKVMFRNSQSWNSVRLSISCNFFLSGMNSGSAALLHTTQRHREILQDYNNEFRKTKANIQQHRQREDLLGGVRRDME